MRGVALGIVALIAVIFAFSGAGTLNLSRAGSGEVAKVEDLIITEQDVAFKLEELKSRIPQENIGLSEEEASQPEVQAVLAAGHAAHPACQAAGRGAQGCQYL